MDLRSITTSLIGPGGQQNMVVDIRKLSAMMVHLNELEQKQKATDNLDKYLQEKDETIHDLREKLENYKTLHNRLESQLSSLIRTRQSGSERFASSATTSINYQDHQPHTLSVVSSVSEEGACIAVSSNHRILPTSSPECVQEEKKSHDLEIDGACSSSINVCHSGFLEIDGAAAMQKMHPSFRHSVSATCNLPSSQPSTKPYSRSKSQVPLVSQEGKALPHTTSDSHEPNEAQQNQFFITRDEKLDTPVCKHLPTTEPSCSSMTSSMPSGNLTSLAQTLPSLASSSASPDLVKKLMSQNGRLKKVMRDILKQKNLTVQDYLDKEEYEDTIQQLRLELSSERARCEKLKSILSQLDNSEIKKLASRCAELEEMVVKLNRSLVVKQTMVQSYSEAYEKLKKEMKEGKSAKDNVTSGELSLKGDLAQVAKEDIRLKEDYHRLLADHQELTGRYNGLLKSREGKDGNTETLISKCRELENKIHIQKNQIHDEYHTKLDERDVKISNQKQMIERLSKECQDLRHELSQLSKRMSVPQPLLMESMSLDYRALTGKNDICMDSGAQSMDLSASSGLVCPRCDQTFSATERRKYQEHTKKCTNE